MILNLYDFDKTIYDGDIVFVSKKTKSYCVFCHNRLKGLLDMLPAFIQKKNIKVFFSASFAGLIMWTSVSMNFG